MRRVLASLLVVAVTIAGAWWLSLLPGHVSAQIGGTTLEASAPMAIFALVVAFALAYAAIRLLAWIAGAPRRGGIWLLGRRRRQGERSVTAALLALAAAEPVQARQEAARARRLLGDTPQTLLLAAQAGRLAGREDEAQAAFRALADRPDAAFIGLRGLLSEAVGRSDWAEAVALARQAEAAHPGTAWLRTERAQLAIRTGNWAEALELVEEEQPRAALATAAAEREADADRATKLAKQAWTAEPGLAAAALAYARRLREAGRENRAQDVIRRTWAVAPHPDLGRFALAKADAPPARYTLARALAASGPDHLEGHLLLARTALDAGMMAEARAHLAAARALGRPPRRLWLLLAELEQAEHGETEDGRAAQREALREAGTAAADPTWHCGQCGTAQAAWSPVCPVCSAIGRMGWGVAPAPRVMLPAPSTV